MLLFPRLHFELGFLRRPSLFSGSGLTKLGDLDLLKRALDTSIQLGGKNIAKQEQNEERMVGTDTDSTAMLCGQK
jgi:hypothetical protein